MALATAYDGLDDYEKAVQELKNALPIVLRKPDAEMAMTFALQVSQSQKRFTDSIQEEELKAVERLGMCRTEEELEDGREKQSALVSNPTLLEYANLILKIGRALGHRDAEAHALCLIGHVQFEEGKVEEAASSVLEGLRIAEQEGLDPLRLQALFLLKTAFDAQMDWDEAIKYSKLYNKLLEQVGPPDQLVPAMVSLSYLHVADGNLTDAISSCQKAARHAANGDETLKNQSRVCLAAAHSLTGNFGLASENIVESLTYARKAGNGRAQVESLRNLGMVSLALGNNEDAREHLDASEALARDLGCPYEKALASSGPGLARPDPRGLPASERTPGRSAEHDDQADQGVELRMVG